MFLPIGDYPNPQKPQWITRILIGINVALFLFINLPMKRTLTVAEQEDPEMQAVVEEMDEVYREFTDGAQGATVEHVNRFDVFVYEHGYKPAKPSLLDLLFSMFLHAGFGHIFGNLLFLWIYGDNVEARLGPLRFLFAYLVTGAIATLSYAALDPESGVPLIGASGAISGVLGFYLVWFPHNRIKVLFFLYFFIQVFHISAAVVLIFYIVVSNILPMLLGGGGSVAYGAHLGGFAAGAAGALLLNAIFGRHPAPRPQVERSHRYGRQEFRQVRAREVPTARNELASAIGAGRMEDAAYAFARLARDGGAPPEPRDVFTLADWLYQNEFVRDAAAVFRYYIRNFPRGADLDRVHLGLGVLLSRRMGQGTAARQHLLTAIELSEPGATVAETARAELRNIEAGG